MNILTVYLQIPIYPNAGSLPVPASTSQLAYSQSDMSVYVYTGAGWFNIGGGSGGGPYSADESTLHLTGSIFSIKSSGVSTLQIADSSVINSKLSPMAANTLKGNNTGSSAVALDLTVSQVLTMLNILVGSNQIAFGTGTSIIGTNDFTWDNVNKVLNINGDIIATSITAALPVMPTLTFLGNLNDISDPPQNLTVANMKTALGIVGAVTISNKQIGFGDPSSNLIGSDDLQWNNSTKNFFINGSGNIGVSSSLQTGKLVIGAVSAEALDQDTIGGGNISGNTTAPARWQSFIPSVTGNLTKLDIYFGTISAGNFNIFIYSGTGLGGTLLLSEVHAVSAGNGVKTIILNTLISLSSGNTYTVAFNRVDSANFQTTYGTGNPYANGTCDLASLGIIPNSDYRIKTYMSSIRKDLIIDASGNATFYDVGSGKTLAINGDITAMNGGFTAAIQCQSYLRIANNATIPYLALGDDSGITGPVFGRSLSDGDWFTDSLAGDGNLRHGNTAKNINIGVGAGATKIKVSNTNVAINNTSVSIGSSSANSSAIFELTSTTKGFLPSRMTTTQRLAISTPADGLIVYDTTLKQLFEYDGTTWNLLSNISNATEVIIAADDFELSGLTKFFYSFQGTANDTFNFTGSASSLLDSPSLTFTNDTNFLLTFTSEEGSKFSSAGVGPVDSIIINGWDSVSFKVVSVNVGVSPTGYLIRII